MAAATAAELHRRAQQETERGRHAVARRLLHRALRSDPDPEARARILITLAYHEADRMPSTGLALLDQADALPGLPPQLRGLAASQRGLLLLRAGMVNEAIVSFDRAAGLLDESTPEILCRNLLNRGLAHTRRRRHRAARADYARCAELARRHGLVLLAAKVEHNLGYLFLLSGDVPAALRAMDEVESVLSTESPAHAAVYHADRAQVLLAAGLFGEADEDLARAAALYQAAGLRHDQATIELERAQLALREERWSDAGRLAARARRRFARRGAAYWEMLSAHVVMAAGVGAGRHRGVASHAVELATRLAAIGLADDARAARRTAAFAVLEGSSPDRAARAEEVAASAIRTRRGDSIVTRLQLRALRAAVAHERGETARAQRERVVALTELHRHQASFGSLDLQTAGGNHARRLARDGLLRALSSGRPAALFAWAERARALSARLPTVHPPTDERAAALLEELRHARRELRHQTLSGRVDPHLRNRCTDLEQLIRRRSWYLPGPVQTIAPAPLSRVREHLATASATLVVHLIVGGRLVALVVTARRQEIRDLGPAEPAIETRRRLRSDLDMLASDGLPEPLRATIRAARRSALRRLDEVMWQPLRDVIADGPLLLAPSARLVTTPWPLVPTIRGRAVAVVASVTGWLSRRDRVLPENPTVALAAGPEIDRAADELRLVGQVWSQPATKELSTAAHVRAAAVTADILHVAAHGTHEPDNPLFSHLHLEDGPLFGYELERLPRLPDHVVLSACELGLSGARAGDETLGMTVALLHGGARSVVAGVAQVSDRTACRVAPVYHAALRRRLPPAAALAEAVATVERDDDPPPLVCFGAGW